MIHREVFIDADPLLVWDHLTNIALMKQWMVDDEVELEILTSWIPGSPFMIKGKLHGLEFLNSGEVLKYEKGRMLQYSHLSSISNLPDDPSNYSVLEFRLEPLDSSTKLILEITNFPTASIFHHMNFYWSTAIGILKNIVERHK
jgi:uncharacterized protein YndB with AHSA1/START domain